MTRQEALAHVLTLAANGIEPPPGLARMPDYREVVVDMPRPYYKKLRDWLEEHEFITEII